ncbi:hypothetical protein RDV84_22195 [Lysobacter yananisis]|uniref:NACHT domain-containing protein n=1 Tax=Lysobacter yananisis TaxID=1003114 RepID=A0ABY9P6K6_9GAMM|nr:hypothetical protein [Lysobacter yananisis]WMT02644.1 hypothetical protein RDV84_22195 [Lysobacter yananisis]
MNAIMAMIAKYPLAAILSMIATPLAALASIAKIAAAVRDWLIKNDAQKIAKQLTLNTGVTSFTKEDITQSCKNYLQPNCTQIDPSNEDDLHNVVAHAPLFKTVDDHFSIGGQQRHIILLADSGMGKTSFCLNYYAKELKKNKNERTQVVIIPLGRSDAIEQIKSVQNKRNIICFLDAFDEDPNATTKQEERLTELMRAAADFKNIIITCRSQFFARDESIPNRSGIMYAAPLKAGQNKEFPLHRIFIAPFSKEQISKYISKQFPILHIANIKRRKYALEMVSSIPELSSRPMLLELVPDLVREKKLIKELFGLYEFLIQSWLERESHWIKEKDLLEISTEIAVIAYRQQREGLGDRLPASLIESLANDHETPLESWKLKARSLLNRDIEGQFKFAHRSIMEYLVLLAAIKFDARCYEFEWTDLMKDLLVSWGNTKSANPKDILELLGKNHASTGLFPLASPLKQPQLRSMTDCKEILRLSNISSRRSRGVPLSWRNQSIKVAVASRASTASAYEICDSTHGICWLITDTQTIMERTPYRDTFDSGSSPISLKSKFIKNTSLTRRFPSLEEILSLWESEPYIVSNYDIKCIFDKEELYWLGDRGDTGPLCCSFGESPLDLSHLKIQASKSEPTGRHIHVYALTNRYASISGKACLAMSAHIIERSGT